MTIQNRNFALIAGVLTCAWLWFVVSGALEWFELKTLDFFLNRIPPPANDSTIIVVEYDDKTAENLTWPATKSDIGALVHIIQEQAPRVVALDLFSLYGLLNHPDTSGLFEEALARCANISYGIGFIVPVDKDDGAGTDDAFGYLDRHLYPLPATHKRPDFYRAQHLFTPVYRYYDQSKSVGHLVLKNDADGMFRRIPAFIQCGRGALPTLGLQAALDYRGVVKEEVKIDKRSIRVGGDNPLALPVDGKGLMAIRYHDRRNRLPVVSMIDVLIAYKDKESPAHDPGMFRDRLVFIGNTSSRTARFCPTPLHSYYPTILMHATVAQNVLLDTCIRSLDKGTLVALMLVFCVLVTFLIARSANIVRTSLALGGVIAAMLCTGYILATQFDFYLPLFSLMSFILFLCASLLVYRYITYKEYLLLSLKELQDAMRLRERLAAIGEVSARVAHEIRNPLNAIQLYTSLLKRESRDEGEARERLNIIHEETLRLNRFITRLLGYARPGEPVITALNLKNELDFVLNIIAPDAQEKKIDIDLQGVADATTISGDPDQIRECFINITKNSVEAMENGGKLVIRAVADKERVSLSFEDSGKGIPKDEIDKIFNPFYSTKKSGTGLGLPLVKKIIEAHNGAITIQSEPGRGTVLAITLPAKKDAASKGADNEEIQSAGRGR